MGTHPAVQREGSKLCLFSTTCSLHVSLTLVSPLNDNICYCIDYFEIKCYAIYLKYLEEGQTKKQSYIFPFSGSNPYPAMLGWLH